MKKRLLLSVIGSVFLVGSLQLWPGTDKNGHFLEENDTKKVVSSENSDDGEVETDERNDEIANVQIKPTKRNDETVNAQIKPAEDISKNTIIETECHPTQEETAVNRTIPAQKTETDKTEIKEKKNQKISENVSVSSEIIVEDRNLPSNHQETVNNDEKIKDNVTDEKNEEQIYEYDVGNIGKLYDTEEEAYTAAEACFNDFSDPDKYVSSYFLYSTYDKWTFNLYYSYY